MTNYEANRRVEASLAKSREATEAAERTKAGLELARLHRENEQLRGEAGQLHQQLRETNAQHATELVRAATMAAGAALRLSQGAAPAPTPQSAAPQQTTRPAEWAGKSPVELIAMGLEQTKPERAGL